MGERRYQDLALSDRVQRALNALGYDTPTPIQAQAIPPILAGRDVLGCAQTGTGKTAAFALPILHRIGEDQRSTRPKAVRALVLVPTRELAMQVMQSFEKYGRHVRFFKALVYGGVGYTPQIRALAKGVDVLVATPGRLMDLIREGHVDLQHVEQLVLDEADRMLDMGFIHDMKKIVAMIGSDRQTLFFSATMEPKVRELAATMLTDPFEITIAPKQTTAEKIEQFMCFLTREDKMPLLLELLREQQNDPEKPLTLIFGRTKYGCEKLVRKLKKEAIRVEAIHGDKSQAARERALAAFRKRKVRLLVATDVAARGIDVKGITLVINYDLPDDPEAYVHRIGRTARAEAEGMALSFCAHDEYDKLREIERLIRQSIPVLEEHPYHDQDIAAGYLKSKNGAGRGSQRRRRRPRNPDGAGPGRPSGQGRSNAERRKSRGKSRRRRH
ncbi:MAG: DEAD/DEAH box helicase [Verrucomicrobiota bacterium]